MIPADGYYYIIIAALILFFITAGGVIAILWIAMPFSIFGTKGLIKKLLQEQERTNLLLAEMLSSVRQKEQETEIATAISAGKEKAADAHTEPER
ncbi:hypothetical protein EPN18_09040 [bacterium]|nr:MAG: hypothetical protein EPN18_09040 [bacterium]